MKKTKFIESQIVAAIKKQESGISTKEVARELGVSEATFYNWKARYGGIAVKRNILRSTAPAITAYRLTTFSICNKKRSISLLLSVIICVSPFRPFLNSIVFP